jgi:tRNA modification GTPase
VRISGPQAVGAFERLTGSVLARRTQGIVGTKIVFEGLRLEARLYLFVAPYSYTGQDVVEAHVLANQSTVDLLVQSLLQHGLRAAGPGEFTARAYLNGKIDLFQAEAVNEVIFSTSHMQCRAAERMLQGRLSSTLDSIRSKIVEGLSLIEAGLDFDEEETGSVAVEQTIEGLRDVQRRLEGLLSETAQTDSMTHLPSVGIAGVPNAGKSTLFNALLGKPRSLVSDHRKTTRDVLEAVLDLPHDRCVVFDCAGLLVQEEGIQDQLAQQAALQSLGRSDLVLFCVDLSKSDWQEDLAIRRRVAAKASMGVATKADLLESTERAGRLDQLARTLGESFLPLSAETGMNLLCLRDRIEQRLLSGRSRSDLSDAGQVHTMITARFRQTGTEAIDQLSQALYALEHGQSDIAAMMVRAAYQALSDTEHHVDEKVLDILFSRFCIGK